MINCNAANHQGIQRRMVLVVNFFVYLKLLFFCFIVAMSDNLQFPGHDVGPGQKPRRQVSHATTHI